jgi:hypothetical protein
MSSGVSVSLRAWRGKISGAALSATISLQTVSEQLQAELLERGRENVRTTIARLEAGLTVVVE